MKKIRSVFALVLGLCLLLCGCNQAEPVSSSHPTSLPTVPEATEPELAAPPETTTPPETTVPDVTESVAETQPDYTPYYELLDASQGRNWLHDVLGCVFTTPENISLYHFFYSGMPDCSWNSVSDETADWLVSQGFTKNLDLQVRPVEQMEEVMQTIFGISLDDVETAIPESWVYYEKDDCYYSNKNDAWGIGRFEITWIEIRDDGSVQIFYHSEFGTAANAIGETFSNEPMMLTLRLNADGTYHVLSNTVVAGK